MPLREEVLTRANRGDDFPDPEGELVEVLECNRTSLKVITRVEGSAVEPPLDPTEYSVPDLRDELRGHDLTDEERDAMLDVEKANKNRTTAINAIEA